MSTEIFSDRPQPQRKKYTYTDSRGTIHRFTMDHQPSDDEFDSIKNHYETKLQTFDDNLAASEKATDPQGKLSHAVDVAQEPISSTSNLIDDTRRLFGQNVEKKPEKSHPYADLGMSVVNPMAALRTAKRSAHWAGDKLSQFDNSALSYTGGLTNELIDNTEKTGSGLTSPVGLLATLAGAPEAQAIKGIPLLSKVLTGAFGLQSAGQTKEGISEGDPQKAFMGLAGLAGTGAHVLGGTKLGNATPVNAARMAAAAPLDLAGRALENPKAPALTGYTVGSAMGHPWHGAILGKAFADEVKGTGTGLRNLAKRLNPEDSVPLASMDEQTVKSPEVQEYADEVDPALKDISEKIASEKDIQTEASLLQKDPPQTPVEPLDYTEEKGRVGQNLADDTSKAIEEGAAFDQNPKYAQEPAHTSMEPVDPLYDSEVQRLKANHEKDLFESAQEGAAKIAAERAAQEKKALNVKLPEKAKPASIVQPDGSIKITGQENLTSDQKLMIDGVMEDYQKRMAEDPSKAKRHKAMLTSAIRDIIENKNPQMSAVSEFGPKVKEPQGSHPFDKTYPLDRAIKLWADLYDKPDEYSRAVDALQSEFQAAHKLPVDINYDAFLNKGYTPQEAQHSILKTHAMLAEQAKVNPDLISHMQKKGWRVKIDPNGRQFKLNGVLQDSAGSVNYPNRTMSLYPSKGIGNVMHAVGLHEMGHVVAGIIMKRIAQQQTSYDLAMKQHGSINHPVVDRAHSNLTASKGALSRLQATFEKPVSSYSQKYHGADNGVSISEPVTQTDPLFYNAPLELSKLGNERFADMYSSVGPHRSPLVRLMDRDPSAQMLMAFENLMKLMRPTGEK